jgi:hypothetical protein
MAAFPPPFGAGIAFGGTVPSGGGAGLGLNGINDNLPKAPNLVDGDATYNPAVGVTIGGAGIFISGTGWRVIAAAQINNYGGSVVGQAGIAGLTFTGGAGAPGVQSTGGSGGGTGGIFTGAGGGNGLSGIGQGAGAGVVATGGSSGVGLYCTGNGGAAALQVGSGNIIITGTPPTSSADPGQSHLLSSANICKAWAMIKTDGAGGVTVLDGYNIASVAIAGGSPKYVLVTFARAFASVNYCPTVSACVQGSPDATPVTDFSTRTTTTIRLSWRDTTNTTLAAESAVYYAALQVMGRQ